MDKRRAIQVAIVTASLTGYIWLGYFTARTNFVQVIAIYFALFGFYILMLRSQILSNNFKIIIGVALAFRLALLLMTPNLSDDYFRFVWDGLLTTHGYNPYLILPSALVAGPETIPGITPDLFSHLNSPDYYSVYPPVCQFIFAASARINGANLLANIVTMRVLIVLAELGSIVLLYKLAKKLEFPPYLVAIYAFNPLIIVELTGNLHFEAVMVFFLLLAVYLLIAGRQIYSAATFALAVGTKLLPLIFLPLLIKRIGWVRSLRYFAIVATGLLVLFSPFLSGRPITNFVSSLGLYFQKFEFNASIYYLVRWLGYQITGYNIIAVSGIVLGVISASIIVVVAFREKVVSWPSLFSNMLICATVYFFFATTVHPWYLTSLVMLAVFTKYRYPLVWSSMVMLSYAAYRTFPYSESPWLVAIEYSVVGGWFTYEMMRTVKVRGRPIEP
jgi:alpha-1,6-mannosyltransferase